MLVIAPRSSSDPVNNANGNHAPAPVATDKPKLNIITNKYRQFAMTTPQNKEPRIGSSTSPMNKTTSKNSSCNRCWEEKDRIFKALEPDGLGKSYSL